jgi:hypothetical protein
MPVTALPFGRLRWRVIVNIVSNAGYDPAIMDKIFYAASGFAMQRLALKITPKCKIFYLFFL